MTPTVYREGSFKFNGMRIPCMVLNDGTPMLTVRALRLFLALPSVPGVVTSCVRTDDGELVTDAITTQEFLDAKHRYEDAQWKMRFKRRVRGCKWARGGVDLRTAYKFGSELARTVGLVGVVRAACDYNPLDTRVRAEVAFIRRDLARGKVGVA